MSGQKVSAHIRIMILASAHNVREARRMPSLLTCDMILQLPDYVKHFFHYSFRMAVSGERRIAFMAGARPASIEITVANPTAAK